MDTVAADAHGQRCSHRRWDEDEGVGVDVHHDDRKLPCHDWTTTMSSKAEVGPVRRSCPRCSSHTMERTWEEGKAAWTTIPYHHCTQGLGTCSSNNAGHSQMAAAADGDQNDSEKDLGRRVRERTILGEATTGFGKRGLLLDQVRTSEKGLRVRTEGPGDVRTTDN